MSDVTEQLAADARVTHEKAVIDYLEAIRQEIHALPGRIFLCFLSFGLAVGVIWWLATAML